MAVNDDLADAAVSHSIGLTRLSTATARKVLAQLRRVDARIVERLQRADISTLSRTRMEKLLADIRRVIDGAYIDAMGALQVDLEKLAAYEAQYQLDLFKRVVPVRLETVTPAAAQVVAAVNSRPFQGKLLKEVYRELPAAVFRQVRDTIRGGFIEGRTTDQIVRDLRGTAAQGFKDGILAKTRRDVEAVVRTAVSHTANSAREATYAANADLIKGVQWVSTLDTRTSAVCRARDGKIYEPDKGPRPPAHFNCRSSTTVVLKSWREMGFKADDLPASTRASMNGQVPGDLDYDGWLRRQPKAVQDDILGDKKGDLFRAGLKMDRFVDRSGVEYTLDQLKRREAEIWEKATT